MTEPLVRTHGLSAARAAVAVARRKIEPSDVEFAMANKHRMGWQTIANIRAVNMADLRRHCERGAGLGGLTPVEAKPTPPAAVRCPKINLLAALGAIHEGATSHQDIADLIQCSVSGAGVAVMRLKEKFWLAGNGRSRGGWVITIAGLAALKAAKP